MSRAPYIDIPFGPYMPDLGGRPEPKLAGYLVDAVGVRLTPNGYRGMPQLANVTSSTAFSGSGDVGAGFIANRANGEATFLIFAISSGSSMSLYRSTDYGQNWNVTAVGAAGNPLGVDFAQYGNLVFATLPAFGLGKYDLDGGSPLWAVQTSPASPTTVARVRDHLVCGGQVTLGVYRDDRASVRWSAIGDPEDFPTPGTAEARTKQAGEQYLSRQHGFVGKVVGGEKFGLIFQERAITRMTYVGGSVVYEFDTFEKNEGCGELASISGSSFAPVLRATVIEVGTNRWMWANEHGVFMTDGYTVRSLSEGVIDEALFANTISFPDTVSRVTSAAYDQLRGVVVFKTGSTSQLCYNVAQNTFHFVESSSYHSLFDGKSSLTSSKIQAYNVTTGRQIQRLDGANDGIALQTGFIELDPGYRVQLQGAHLLGADVPGNLTLSYKAASDYDDIDTLQTGFTAMTAAPRGNMLTARADGNFFAFRITGTGAESQLIRGIRVYFQMSARQ